ncbi:MAG: hypothetical protein RL117_380 [Verrucomicrobiota bacterium]|jgi:glucose-6-phosphate dehydrogenase assembly protein OpcA
METMTMDSQLGQEVPVRGIDQALRQLWLQDESRTNARLINLAVYSESAGSLAKNSEIVRELTREHACRAVLIEMDRAAADASIRAWITAHCHLSGGKKSVCCEQIAFALTGVSRGRLRNTVFAHLSSDLPLIFWWQGDLSPIFEERLYAVIDRFVFDSSEWANPQKSFDAIDAALASPRPLVVQDLAWTRTYHMRLAIASLFDDPLAQQSLQQIEKIEITHHPRHRNTGLLLLAWFAQQAGWSTGAELAMKIEAQHGAKEGFAFDDAMGHPVQATLVADEASSSLASVRLLGKNLEIVIERASHSPHLHLRLRVGDHITDTLAPAGADDSGALIGEQLARGGKNSLYRKVLPKFRELLAAHP